MNVSAAQGTEAAQKPGAMLMTVAVLPDRLAMAPLRDAQEAALGEIGAAMTGVENFRPSGLAPSALNGRKALHA